MDAEAGNDDVAQMPENDEALEDEVDRYQRRTATTKTETRPSIHVNPEDIEKMLQKMSEPDSYKEESMAAAASISSVASGKAKSSKSKGAKSKSRNSKAEDS